MLGNYPEYSNRTDDDELLFIKRSFWFWNNFTTVQSLDGGIHIQKHVELQRAHLTVNVESNETKLKMENLSEKARAFLVDAILNPNGELLEKTTNPNNEKQDLNLTFQEKTSLKAQLCYQDLWKKFHKLGTEMIITKAGSRRMFPAIKIQLSGLDKNKKYLVFMDIVPVDNKRYRYIYHSSQWVPAGTGEITNSSRCYIHPDSPSSGKLLMAQESIISFDKLKLTNNKNPIVNGQITLNSMQKYIPRVHIIPDWKEGNYDLKSINTDNAVTFAFPETSFITVTAYQNQQITQLKIASNPFAKGFRESIKRRINDETTNDLYKNDLFLYF